jgi:hypothetical protein
MMRIQKRNVKINVDDDNFDEFSKFSEKARQKKKKSKIRISSFFKSDTQIMIFTLYNKSH